MKVLLKLLSGSSIFLDVPHKVDGNGNLYYPEDIRFPDGYFIFSHGEVENGFQIYREKKLSSFHSLLVPGNRTVH